MKDRHVAIGWDDMNTVGRDFGLISHLSYLHGGAALQNFGQQADMIGIEMRHQHKTHAAIGRYSAEKLLECLQAACGCPDSYNGESIIE